MSCKLLLNFFTYSGLFGTTVYQSFVGGIVAYKALPLDMFGRLQHRVFPIYFSIQTVLSALLLLTSPLQANKVSLWSAILGLASSLINLVVIMPVVHSLMSQRASQEKLEGKSHKDPDVSEAMKSLNRRFAKMHGFSMLVNLGVLGSLITYGVSFVHSVQISI